MVHRKGLECFQIPNDYSTNKRITKEMFNIVRKEKRRPGQGRKKDELSSRLKNVLQRCRIVEKYKELFYIKKGS